MRAIVLSAVALAERGVDEPLFQTMDEFDNFKNRKHNMAMHTTAYNEEDKNSIRIPANFRCEACNAIAYTLEKHHSDFKGKRLDLADGAELIEGACKKDVYLAKYSDAEIPRNSGTIHLIGPGALDQREATDWWKETLTKKDAEELDGSFAQRGLRVWPERLSNECNVMTNDKMEDEDVLALLKKFGKDSATVENKTYVANYRMESDFAQQFCTKLKYCKGLPNMKKSDKQKKQEKSKKKSEKRRAKKDAERKEKMEDIKKDSKKGKFGKTDASMMDEL
jgi:hypothetical protein